MWWKFSGAAHFADVYKGYVNDLKNMELFPCRDFYQIDLDVPRMQFSKESSVEC